MSPADRLPHLQSLLDAAHADPWSYAPILRDALLESTTAVHDVLLSRMQWAVNFVQGDRLYDRRRTHVVYFLPDAKEPFNWFQIYEWRPEKYDDSEEMRIALEQQVARELGTSSARLLPVFVASQRTIPPDE